MRRCMRVTRSVQWVENELRELPTYEGLPNLATFLTNFEGLRIFANFGVINIIDDTNPYPTLLGIDWAIENQTIIFQEQDSLIRR